MEQRIKECVYEMKELAQLQTCLALVRRAQFAEVWLQRAARWPAISGLINGAMAWVMFPRWEGEEG